jgi:hypothetical protein
MTIHLPQLDPRESARERECPSRSEGRCHEIDRRVGWDVAVSIDWCDGCMASGRQPGNLDAITKEIVAAHIDPAVRKHADREVLEALRDRHGVTVGLEEIASASDRKQRWKIVKPSWQNAASFALSMTSRLVFGAVGERRMEARLAACERCPARRQSKGRSFCGVCGCGDTALAALDDKLKNPMLRCPLGRFT